jgi:hypothetical protein
MLSFSFMRKEKVMVKSSAVRVLMLLVVVSAGATEAAQRTFVSAASGSDANPCTRALPCRSFGAAMGQTDAGGEVVVLDSGGYGPVTIGQPVAIIAPPGVHAAVSAFTGNAITVAAASIDVIMLRGLYLNGLGATYGIHFTGGKTLHVENCVVSGFDVGVFGNAPGADVYVLDTISRQNGSGFYFSASSSNRANLDSVHAEENLYQGVVAADNALVTVTRSVAAGNSSVGFFSTHSASVISLESCTTTMNGYYGVFAHGTARVRNSLISGNTNGVGGTTVSFGNNGLHGNGSNGSFTVTVAQQ